MNIPIWPGSSSFQPGDTPFGFYDYDYQFQNDSNKFAKFAAQRLGYPLVEVELQDINFFTALEDAITTYGNEVYAYQVAENLLSFQGNPQTIGLANDRVIQENLASIIRLSQQYGEEAGVGGTIDYRTGSLQLISGQQNYDMNQWALDNKIQGRIEIKRVFYEAPPAITRYFDPYSGTGTGMMQMMDSFGWVSYSPAINFMLMPMNYDLQKIQAIELNDQIRKSQFTFELVNNHLRIFPIPTGGGRDQLRFEYILESDRNMPYVPSTGQDMITNVSNVPYENPIYMKINSIGRSWVFEYALAISKEMLGYVRGKYSTIPIPGSEVTLNQSDLITAASTEKQALIERLRIYFDTTSRKTLLENKALESTSQKTILNDVPMTIFIG